MANGKNAYYHLFTLDAKKILNDAYQVVSDEDNNLTVEFRCNFAEGEIGREIIRSTDSFGDNALFYQMIKVLGISEKDDETCLQHYLVFLDFLDTFNRGSNFTVADTEKSLSEAELKSNAGLPYRLARLFADGFELTFDGKNKKRFVPFDKSNSMARQSRISFIDAAIKEQLEKRLLLDIDFSKILLIPSKYYAYRGLYMSTAYRIEQGEEFRLDEETVIVLPDDSGDIGCTVFTEIKAENESSKNEALKFGSQDQTVNMEFFDGEGLICPEYAQYVSNRLQEDYGFKRASHSFQIRMPFTKGMLHEVNFDKFFSEIAGRETPLSVKDVFGIPRDLRKAKILLTKSMFKCCKWLSEWCEKSCITDPMQFFFSKMKAYEHAFYVTGSDARLSNSGTVRMNYQFWSTLDICPKDFTSLISDHVEKIDAIADIYAGKNVQEGLRYLSEGENPDVEDEVPGSDEDNNWQYIENDVGEREKCLRALGDNPAFISDPKVKEVLEGMRRTSARNLCTGRIEVAGEQRYLSRDLIRLMLYVLWRVGKDDGNVGEKMREKWSEINKECLFRSSRHFYMPEGKLKLKADKYYAFFRSPHLSRHEQCILRPFVKPDGMYARYFGKLRGVVMVSYESFVPMMLGGADFDGDLVKIVSDRRIVDAIKRGAYEKDSKKKREFKRKMALPAIQIPSRTGATCYAPNTIPFDVIANTFSNQIGQISNLAVKIAKKEYGANSGDAEDCKNKCAECTIVTGLEIDAAKTGFHPTKNIEELKALGNKTDIYLDAKVKMADLAKESFFTPYVKEDAPGMLSLYRINPDKKRGAKAVFEDIPVYDEDSNAANIDRLPGAYLKYVQETGLKKEANKDSDETPSKKAEPVCFRFQQDKVWKDNLDTEKKNKVKLLMRAYQKIRSRDYNLKKFRRMSKDSNYLGYIYKILQIQYDSFYQKLPCGIKVGEAYSQTYMTIKDILGDSTRVEEALTRLAKEKWHFTAKGERAEKLAEILGVGMEVPTEAVELLSNFRNNGYMLLCYLLKELQSRLNEGIDAETYKRDIEKTVQEEGTNEYLPELEDIYSRYLEQNATWALWHRAIVARCREFLEEILDGWNVETTLKYVWACPKTDRRNFLWNIFTGKELAEEILAVTPEEDACKEEQGYVG